MTAICREYEYLIERAKRDGDTKLVGLLEASYGRYLDKYTAKD